MSINKDFYMKKLEELENVSLLAAFGTVIAVVAFVVIVVGLAAILNGFTIMTLWGWFVVPFFGLPPMNIPLGIGMGLLTTYMTHQYSGGNERTTKDHLTAVVTKPLATLLIGWIVTFFL